MTAAAVLAALLVVGAAEDGKETARRLLAEGNELLRAKDAEGALDRYEAAYEAYESPKILVNMGEALTTLGRRADAADVLERAIDDLEEGPARDAAAGRLAQLRRRLGSLTVSSVPTASVSIDGEAVGSTPFERSHVEPGVYRIALSAPGFVSTNRDVEVVAKEAATVDVALEAIPKEIVTAPVTPDESDDGWIVWAGAGAAVVVVATVVTIVLVSGGGDDFTPGGELGRTSLDDWSRP